MTNTDIVFNYIRNNRLLTVKQHIFKDSNDFCRGCINKSLCFLAHFTIFLFLFFFFYLFNVSDEYSLVVLMLIQVRETKTDRKNTTSSETREINVEHVHVLDKILHIRLRFAYTYRVGLADESPTELEQRDDAISGTISTSMAH